MSGDARWTGEMAKARLPSRVPGRWPLGCYAALSTLASALALALASATAASSLAIRSWALLAAASALASCSWALASRRASAPLRGFRSSGLPALGRLEVAP